MRRDTLLLEPSGFMVFRFKATNPGKSTRAVLEPALITADLALLTGVWLFHCHIEWHVASGLIATFVEAPLDMQKNLTIPKNHLDACAAAQIPATGNAAANTVNYLDLNGQNAPPPPLPAGFTTRGIVALVFSCLAGILGTAVVAWYGLVEVASESYSENGAALSKPTGLSAQTAPESATREEITETSGDGQAGRVSG